MKISFRIKLLASHAAVAIAVSVVTLLVVERTLSRRMEAQVDSRLESQAQAVSRWLERSRHPHRLAARLAGVVGARVTIIDESGVPVGDSESLSRSDATPIETDEVRAARAGAVGRATRQARSSAEQVRYIAVPAPNRSVVRLGLPIGEVDQIKEDMRRQLAVGAAASLLVALGLAIFVAGALTRRLRSAGELAQRIAAGDYDVSGGSSSTDEIGVLASTLVNAAQELEATETRRREFLANVAHEIRTPVTSIRGYAETLASAEVDAETRGEFVNTIHRNAVRIGRLVEDLLELEALESEQGRALDREPVALAAVVGHVVDTLQAQSSELGARIEVDVAADLSALGDAGAIERILLNLVDNALRHVGRGVRIEVTGERRGAKVALSVRDDGPGIASEHRARIFDRFHSGAGSARGGTGIGLAIAQQLAQAMGGSLALTSTAPEGSEFILELPFCDAP